MARHRRSISSFAGFTAFTLAVVSIPFANFVAHATNTQDLANVALDFNKLASGTQADGTSNPDFGSAFAVNGTLEYLDVGPSNLNAKVTFLSETGARNDRVTKFDVADDDTGENRYVNSEVDFDAAGSPAVDRFVEFEVEFYKTVGGVYTPITVSNLKVSVYDIDNFQFFAIDKASSYQLAQTTVINDTRVGTSRWEFYSGEYSTSTTSSPTATTRSAFSQGRVTLTLDASTKYTFRLGVSKNEASTSGALYILDFGPGKPWGNRDIDAPQNFGALDAPTGQTDKVTFFANGGSGTMSDQRANSTTSLSQNAFTRSGFTFAGWNTDPAGTGTAYADGAQFTFTASTNVTPLYAQWTAVTTRTVTFDANGGSGSMSSQTASSSTALTANTFTRSGLVFSGWNTQADGSGTSYADGASFPFSADTTLYAQWGNPPAPAPYSGPIPVVLTPNVKPAGETMATVLTGERLSGITGAEVDGKKITVTRTSENSVGLNLPALAAGTYDVTYFFGNASVIHQGALVVRAAAATVTPVQTPFTITKRFTGYRGDRGPVVAKDLREITAFINANPGLTSVTCTGSTSGIPAKSTDQALATARATNACNIVKRLVPGITTSISTITGKGVGQFHRAVIITGQGTRP